MINAKQRYKIWIFLASYTIFMATNILKSMVGALGNSVAIFNANSSSGRLIDLLYKASMVLFGGVCFVMILAMSKRQIFIYCRSVKFLMLGVFMWLAWGIFISIGGLAIFTNSHSYSLIIRIIILVISMFMAVKIAYIYDLIKHLVGIRILVLGTVMLAAYIMHFNGLDFLPSITHILDKSDRYRFSFGFSHFNTTGRLCLEFFMLKALYTCILREKSGNMRRVDALLTYLKLLQPVVIIMLISCASRTCIFGVILFWFVYFSLGIYAKTPITIKVMFMFLALTVCVFLCMLINWSALWDAFTIYSLRAENYTSTLPLLTAKNTWLAGLGFSFLDQLNRLREVTYLDSFYLLTLLESGIVGFILLIGTICSFSFMYFRNVMYMTKFHRLAGAMLAILLYYGLFESKMFGRDAIDIMNWFVLIIAANELSDRKARVIRSAKRSRLHKYSVNPHEIRLSVLHNS